MIPQVARDVLADLRKFGRLIQDLPGGYRRPPGVAPEKTHHPVHTDYCISSGLAYKDGEGVITLTPKGQDTCKRENIGG